MYDCHYDLLTNIYINRENLKNVKQYCNNIFKNSIEGGIFNLFYMSKQEMKEELSIKPEEIDVIENLRIVNKLIKQKKLIPENVKYNIGIEGLDYLKNIEDIDVLYDLGVRFVNPVWNNHNKFGTGVRPYEKTNSKEGLTNLGRELIYKLIKKEITIDVSHSDEQTFWDIIEECKKYKNMNPRVIASHSNCKTIFNVQRNLDDNQIKAIQEFNGIIGIVSVKQFCSDENYEQAYIEHIKHAKKILGTVDNIVLSTDDMSYYKIEPEKYQNMNIFKQNIIDYEITKRLKQNGFTQNEVDRIKSENYINFGQNTCKNWKL